MELSTEQHPLTNKINALDSQIEENNDSDAIPKLKNNFFYIHKNYKLLNYKLFNIELNVFFRFLKYLEMK